MSDLAPAALQRDMIPPKPNHRPGSTWARTDVAAAAAAMFRTGSSHADIATDLWVRFQVSVSAAAVAGYLARAGITRTAEDEAVMRQRLAENIERNSMGMISPPAAPAAAPEPGDGDDPPRRRLPRPPAEILPGGAAVLALRRRQCRWPLGEPRSPGFEFCTRDQVDPLSPLNRYCRYHTGLAYERPTVRRREGR